MLNKNSDFSVIILLIGLAIVTLVPFINTGFATGDDLEFMITALNGHSFSVAGIYAKGAGRFYYYLTKPFYDLPYILGDLTFVKSVNLIFVAFNFALLSFIAKLISNDKWVGYFTFLLTLVFVTIKGSNNPITSFLWYFPVSFSFILISIIFALKYIRKSKVSHRTLSFVFYSIGLIFYETYLIYLPLVVFILSFKIIVSDRISIWQKLKGIFIKSAPILMIGGIYLLIYFLFRHFVSSSQYDGTQFSTTFNLKNTINTILNLASGAYPAFYYFNGHSVYEGSSYLLKNHEHNIFSLLISAKPWWYFRAIIVSVFAYYFIKKSSFRNNRRSLLVISLSFLLIYLPHLPLALTQKYSTNYYASNYVTTYFSYASVSLLLPFLFVLVNLLKKHILKKVFQTIIVVFIAIGSLMCDYSNWHSTKDLQITLNTFNSIDEFIETETFKALPNNAYIYSPNLFKHYSNLSWAYLHIWSDYVMAKAKKKVIFSNQKEQFIREFNKVEKPIYYLNFGSDRKSVDRYIAIAEVAKYSLLDSTNFRIYSDSLTLYYYSTYKDFSISFAIGNHADSIKDVRLNDTILHTSNSFVKFRCQYRDYNEYFKPIYISTKSIDMQSVIVSNNLTGKEIDIKL